MKHEMKFPAYAKLAFVLLSITIILVFLYLAHGIIIPILLAMLFAILLRPFVYFLNKRLRFPHVIASMVAVSIAVLLLAGLIFFVSWKIGDIASDWDDIKANLNVHYHRMQHWIKQSFNISYRQQEKYIQEASKDTLPGTEIIGNTMSSFTDVLLNFILVPIYTFLFLLYRNLFLKFLSKLFRPEHQHRLRAVLSQIKLAVQGYLIGLLIEMGIVSALTSIGLAIVGVQFPILLGVITGVLNMIPYIGILVAAVLTMVATLTTSAELSIILGVVVVNVIVQLVDNNVLVPLVVSSKVKINAFVSIVCIIVGNALGGVSGMFLAIPIIAMLKVIFDRIEALEPWGFLMGDDLPKTYEWGGVKLPHYDAGDAKDTETPKK